MPQTETPGRLQAELMSRGLRMTRQRRTILQVVETAKQHLDASQILRKAKQVDPQLDHIHMACLRCGKIMEFESDLFDRLKGQIQRDCRFHIVVSRLEVGGYCAQCRATPSE